MLCVLLFGSLFSENVPTLQQEIYCGN